MASTDARPVPRKNVAFRYYFAVRKNDGTLITTWTGQDSEVDKDGAGFSDCTNEATEIGTTGVGYLDLTSTEMNADAVNLKITVTNTDALPIVVTFFPEESGDYRVADTQKVDVETIKTQTVTCAAGVTVLASVGTAATSTAQTGDSFALANGASGFVAIKGDTVDIEADTQDIQSRLPAALVNSRMDSTVDGTGMETGAVDNILNRDASGSTTNSTLGAIINDWENGGRLDLIIDNVNTLVAGNDTYLSGLNSRIPAALTADGNMKADALRINGQLTSAAATVTFPATIASTTNITAGTITTVTNLTNAPTSGDLTSTMKDSVETAVTTALGGTDVTDFTAIPSGTPNVLEALGFLYAQGFYRKEQTATTTTLFDGDDVAIAEATTSDDSTTFIRTRFTAP